MDLLVLWICVDFVGLYYWLVNFLFLNIFIFHTSQMSANFFWVFSETQLIRHQKASCFIKIFCSRKILYVETNTCKKEDQMHTKKNLNYTTFYFKKKKTHHARNGISDAITKNNHLGVYRLKIPYYLELNCSWKRKNCIFLLINATKSINSIEKSNALYLNFA